MFFLLIYLTLFCIFFLLFLNFLFQVYIEMRFLSTAVADRMPSFIIEELKADGKVGPYKLKKDRSPCDAERLRQVSTIHIVRASPAQLYCANNLRSYPHM